MRSISTDPSKNEYRVSLKSYTIRKYNKEDLEIWNDFIKKSINGSFLFYRDFMEYHEDRFDDFSLLIYKNQHLVGIIPANYSNNYVFSHQGLTYGGLILKHYLGAKKLMEIISEVLKFLSGQNKNAFVVKLIPFFYCNQPLYGIETLLWEVGAKLKTKREKFFYRLSFTFKNS